MVPEELPVVQRDLLRPLQHHLSDLIKMTTKVLANGVTYLFEVGTFLGFTSFALNAANQSSHGTAE